jgi:hypothetical protein
VVQFDAQVVFVTLTWGRRHVGLSRSAPPFKVEFFEVFDDPFVQSEFARRQQVFVPVLGRPTWLPTPEDVIVQKLRWGRPRTWKMPATCSLSKAQPLSTWHREVVRATRDSGTTADRAVRYPATVSAGHWWRPFRTHAFLSLEKISKNPLTPTLRQA